MGKKVHKTKTGVDYRHTGQSEYEYFHSTACGYVRENVTCKDKEVTCKLCLREMKKNGK